MKPEITIDDFSAIAEKLDVRYGTITSVEFLPKNKKMLKLEVDFDTEERTVITNIGDKIEEPEETLLGKVFPFLLNLPPFESKGITSTAMILISKNGDNGIELNPSNGSTIF